MPIAAAMAFLRGGGLGVLRLDGAIVAGSRIALESAVAPGRIFKLRVVECALPRMVWHSGTFIFGGNRVFTVTEAGQGTEFCMTETYHGVMLGLIWRSMPDMQPGFEQFVDGVKRLAEGGGP